MLCYGSDFLVRTSSKPEVPFVIFSKETLKEDPDEEPYSMHPESERSLLWTPEETEYAESE
jgi:hypothetical protein